MSLCLCLTLNIALKQCFTFFFPKTLEMTSRLFLKVGKLLKLSKIKFGKKSLTFFICQTKYFWQSLLCFSQKRRKWPLDALEPLKNFKIKNSEKHFVWQMTKFNFVCFVFPNNCSVNVLRAFQVSKDHFQCFWENKVKQSKICPFRRKQRQREIPKWD